MRSLALFLLAFPPVWALPVSAQTPPTPPAHLRTTGLPGTPALGPVSLVTAAPRVGQRLELRVDIETMATRPYYPYSAVADGYGSVDGITVDATVSTPDGRTYVVPAFFHVPYQRQEDGGREAIGATGPADWRVRLLPDVAGRYRVRLSATDAAGTASSLDADVDVAPGQARGLVRVSPTDPRMLVYANGDDFIPIAEGHQWTPDQARPTLSYQEAFAADAAAGINLTRLWDQNDSYNLAIEGSDFVWEPKWSQYSRALGIELAGARSGRRAARFRSLQAANTDGYFQRVAVMPDTSYVLRGFVRTDALSGGGAFLSVRATSTMQPGSVRTNPVTGTTAWTEVRLTFRTGAAERVIGVWAGASNAVGTAWFDDVFLSPEGASFNVLSDGGFERHFPKSDRGNDPEDPTVNLTVPKGTDVNQWSAYRLDKILEGAETSGIAVQLCQHGDVYWTWDATVYSTNYATANGYVTTWTDARHVGYWKRNLRYRIARWGYSPAVLAWEFWNEHGHIPITGTSEQTEQFRFYQQIVPFVTALDAYDHLVTTSQGSQAYSPEFFTAVGMTVVNYHDYITTQLNRHPREWVEDAALFVYQNANDLVRRWPSGTPRLPFVWGEMGTLTVWNTSDPVATTGTGGAISRHNWLWAGLFSPVLTSPVDWQTSPKRASTAPLRAFFNGERYSTARWTLAGTTDLGATGISVTDARLRVMALVSSDGGRVLAWLQHRDHTWAKVARDGLTPVPFTASFTGPSLAAGRYRLEWWDTAAGTIATTTIVDHPGGAITVPLPAPLATDVALKIVGGRS